MQKHTTPNPHDIVQWEPFDPRSLLESLKIHFPDTFHRGLGLWEGYNLEEHTLMVLRQFEKYFSSKSLPGGFSKAQFRYFLAIHDIGKPDWVSKKKIGTQADYNLKAFRAHFPKDPFIGYEQRRLLESFLSDDPIGSYLKLKRWKGHPDPEDRQTCVSRLLQMHELSGSWLSRSEFLDSFLVYYMSDAGSYTVDAGGLKSLDEHFDFGDGKMDFSPSTKKWVDAVRDRFV